MPLNTSLIRAICFDVDGTLSDTDDLMVKKILPLVRPFRWMSPRFESPLIARRLIMSLETPGNTMYYLLDRLGMDAFAGKVYNMITRYVLHPGKKEYLLVPGTKHLVETLRQHFPMAIVSAGPQSGTLGFLEAFDLLSQFKAVATSQTCKYTKPFPHPILWAAAQMGIDPQHCLMVGDTVVDIKASKAAGAQTVGVLCGFGEEAELRKAGADMILNSPVELLYSLGLEAA